MVQRATTPKSIDAEPTWLLKCNVQLSYLQISPKRTFFHLKDYFKFSLKAYGEEHLRTKVEVIWE